jgi:hypothetical protein
MTKTHPFIFDRWTGMKHGLVGKAKKLSCLSDIYPIGITLPT